MSRNSVIWQNLIHSVNQRHNLKRARGHKHFLEFTNCRFHHWVLQHTISNKTPEFVKQLLNVWYEVYMRFFKA